MLGQRSRCAVSAWSPVESPVGPRGWQGGQSWQQGRPGTEQGLGILDALLLVGLGFSAGVEASAGSESVFFLQHAFSVTQSCPALCDPLDCSPPGSSAYGIFQARILEWVDMPSSRGSFQSRH